jgi:hypothetical protein
MKHIKNYQSFINEGAYLNSKGQAVLSWENDRENPDEVLKSANITRTRSNRDVKDAVDFQGEIPRSNQVGSASRDVGAGYGFPIFFGLSADDYTGKVDDPARFRDTMAQLKAANIENAEESVLQFIKGSFKYLQISQHFKPDYIVTIGSTKGLVGHLAKAANKIFPEADPINLDKVKYLNAGDAIDWEELKAQTGRQAKGASTLEMVKSNILKYVDTDNVDYEFIRLIKATTDIDDLRRLITASGRYISPETQLKWREVIDGETMTPFIVRTSGRNPGGLKSFFKTKYSFDDQEFIEAVINCYRLGKKMLIMDDNKNTGSDINTIRKNILDILSGAGLDDQELGKAITQYGFYVLYKMNTKSGWKFNTQLGKTLTAKGAATDAKKIDFFRKSKGWSTSD